MCNVSKYIKPSNHSTPPGQFPLTSVCDAVPGHVQHEAPQAPRQGVGHGPQARVVQAAEPRGLDREIETRSGGWNSFSFLVSFLFFFGFFLFFCFFWILFSVSLFLLSCFLLLFLFFGVLVSFVFLLSCSVSFFLVSWVGSLSLSSLFWLSCSVGVFFFPVTFFWVVTWFGSLFFVPVSLIPPPPKKKSAASRFRS